MTFNNCLQCILNKEGKTNLTGKLLHNDNNFVELAMKAR